jgi:branched-chain amino acid aminotransferase
MIINGRHIAPELAIKGDSFLLGDGVFETIRTYSNRPFALAEHLQRLAMGAAEIVAPLPDTEKMSSAISELLEREPLNSGRLRIVYGSDGNWIVTHDPYQPPAKALRLTIEGRSGTDFQSAKITSYGWRFSARRKAQAAGFDDLLIRVDSGQISEASTCNLIALVGGNWVTPPLTSGCLSGITRQFLIEEFGILEEEIFDLREANLTSLALVSSLREIQSVSEVDGRIFDSSAELLRLQSAFSSWILGKLAT